MQKALILAAGLTLGGCAGLECDTDWFETGRRDGRLGASSQVDSYISRCGAAKVDRARYEEGWEEGRDMRPRLQFL